MLKEQLQNPQFREFVDVFAFLYLLLMIETKVSRWSTNWPSRTLNRSRPTNPTVLTIPHGSPPCLPV